MSTFLPVILSEAQRSRRNAGEGAAGLSKISNFSERSEGGSSSPLIDVNNVGEAEICSIAPESIRGRSTTHPPSGSVRV
jgi:hypothetical protein